MDEIDAIRRVKQKDTTGLHWLINRYYAKALQVAFLITGDLGTAEDVVQDKFLDLYSTISTFDGERPFSPWFMRGVMHHAVHIAESETRFVSLEVNEKEDSFDFIAVDETTPEESVISNETRQKVWDALMRLSPRQREVVIERYFLEMTEREMVNEMSIAPGTVKWLLNAAKKNLRILLAHERSNP
jgi:RNA polymerase sigma-70 factor (ECF subfamily)